MIQSNVNRFSIRFPAGDPGFLHEIETVHTPGKVQQMLFRRPFMERIKLLEQCITRLFTVSLHSSLSVSSGAIRKFQSKYRHGVVFNLVGYVLLLDSITMRKLAFVRYNENQFKCAMGYT